MATRPYEYWSCDPLLSGCLPPIGEKLFEALACKRMINELSHHFERHCCHVGTNARCFDNVNRMTNTGREYFGFPIIVVIDFDDVADELQTVLPNVIEPAHERANVGCTRFRCEDRLRGRKAKCDVHQIGRA